MDTRITYAKVSADKISSRTPPPTRPTVVAPQGATVVGYRSPRAELVTASREVRGEVRVPTATEFVEPDLFFMLAGVSCKQCHAMTEYDRLRTIVDFYNPGALPEVHFPRGYTPTAADLGLDSDTLAAYRLLMGKYAGFCQTDGRHTPGRALYTMGLTCAQWLAYSPDDRFVHLLNYAALGRTPTSPGAMDALVAYAEEMTAYCGGVRPSGDVPVTVTDPTRLWKGTTVVAVGVAAVLAWKLSRANARIRKESPRRSP